MQQMGGRVMGTDTGPTLMINLQFQRGTDADLALMHHDFMSKNIAQFFQGLAHLDGYACRRHAAAITDLTTRLGIKRRLVQQQETGLSRAQDIHVFAIRQQGGDNAFSRFCIIA